MTAERVYQGMLRRFLSAVVVRLWGPAVYGFLLALAPELDAARAYRAAVWTSPLGPRSFYAAAYRELRGASAPPGRPAGYSLHERALLALRIDRGWNWEAIGRVLGLSPAAIALEFHAMRATPRLRSRHSRSASRS